MTSLRLFLATSLLFSGPAGALAEGKLDLPLMTPISAQTAVQDKMRPEIPLALWTPGTPLAERGESRSVLAISHAGYATMSGFGMAQSAGSFGRSRDATAATLGFGVVGLVQLWNLWRLKDAHEQKR